MHLFRGFIEYQTAVGAFFLTAAAATAQALLNVRFSAAVLLGFSGTGTAAHANVFDCAAEAGRFMPLEMGQADKNICIHNSTSNLGSLHILTALNRNLDIVRTL